MACVCHCAGNSGSVFDWSWLATQIEESSRLRGSRAVPPDVVVGSQGRCPRVACIPMVNYDGTVLVSARFASFRANSFLGLPQTVPQRQSAARRQNLHTRTTNRLLSLLSFSLLGVASRDILVVFSSLSILEASWSTVP